VLASPLQLVCLEEATAFWAVLAHYAGCVYGTCHNRRLSASTCYDPDRLLSKYLKVPTEAFSMLWSGFKPTVFSDVGVLPLGLCVVSGGSHYGPWSSAHLVPSSHKKRVLVWPLSVVRNLCLLCVPLNHRPSSGRIRPCLPDVSDPLVNS